MSRPMTPAEQKALDALYVWLHSEGGDIELIDACVDFHEERIDCGHADDEANGIERIVVPPYGGLGGRAS